MTLRLTVAALKGDFGKEFQIAFSDVSDAGYAAIVEAGTTVKTQARLNIASAGFSTKWQNALRVNIYRNKGIDAAAYIYHKIFYAGVFEDGATIAKNKPMWVRLPSTPKKIGTKSLTAARFSSEIGPLQYVNGSKPLLFGKVAVNGPGDTSVTLNKIRQAYGRSTKRQGSKTRNLAGGQLAREGYSVKSVPMFVGVSRVKIPKKFSIADICQNAANRLAELYTKNFKGD